MGWPQSQDYNEAVQNPHTVFGDAELRGGQAVRNVLGLPMPRSGNFADVYEFIGASGQKWAVKCFTRQIPGLQERYDEISKHLVRAKLPFTVDFSYLAKGIHISGGFYPILKMRWVEGSLLNVFVRDNLDKPALLKGLSQVWLRMAKSLAKSGIAHADLQHGNIMFVPGRKAAKLAVKLIDYDGMWLPALADKKSGEVGHPNYQHPERLRLGTYSAAVDRLPLLAIACALRCLAVRGKTLWDKYDNGDNLLFRETDLRDPGTSDLFKELWNLNDAASHHLTGYLAAALTHGLDETPHLQALTNGDEVRPLANAEERYVNGFLGRGAMLGGSVTPVAAIDESFKVNQRTPLPPILTRTSSAGDSDWDITDDEEAVAGFRRNSSFATSTKMWLALAVAIGICVGGAVGLWMVQTGVTGIGGDATATGREVNGEKQGATRPRADHVEPKPAPPNLIKPIMPSQKMIQPGTIDGANSFVPLFNGRDMTGWKPFPAQNTNWHVRNGVLFGYGISRSFLVTERDDFQDFHLRAEVRINTGGNSGVFFRVLFGPQDPFGYEAEITDDQQNPARTGSLFASGIPVVDVRDSAAPPEQWLALDVTSIGNHIIIKINGKTTADYFDGQNTHRTGHIALQQDTAQTMAEFRKVEIKEFKWGASSQQQGLWRGTEKPAPVLTSNWDHVFKMSGVKELDGYLSIPAESLICTQQKYTGPIDITAIARTAKENIRLCAYNGACVIFNWEANPTELRVNRPDGTFRFESGSLATARVTPLLPNVWYKLRWRITKNGMRVTVDDRLVFSEIKEYDLSAKRPVYVKSATHQVDVKYFSVEPLHATSGGTSVRQGSSSLAKR